MHKFKSQYMYPRPVPLDRPWSAAEVQTMAIAFARAIPCRHDEGGLPGCYFAPAPKGGDQKALGRVLRDPDIETENATELLRR